MIFNSALTINLSNKAAVVVDISKQVWIHVHSPILLSVQEKQPKTWRQLEDAWRGWEPSRDRKQEAPVTKGTTITMSRGGKAKRRDKQLITGKPAESHDLSPTTSCMWPAGLASHSLSVEFPLHHVILQPEQPHGHWPHTLALPPLTWAYLSGLLARPSPIVRMWLV